MTGAPLALLAVVGSARVFHAVLDRAVPLADLVRVGGLDPREVARAQAFRSPDHAHRFAASRAILRHVLGAELGITPAQVVLATTAGGKPHVDGPGPAFSLSHAQDYVVIAVSDTQAVGVDVEDRRRLPADATAFSDLMALCLTAAEFDTVAGSHDPRLTFLRFWTAKEARMKLTGEGLSLAPRAIEVHSDDGVPTGIDRPTWPPVALHMFHLPEAVVALALGPRDVHTQA